MSRLPKNGDSAVVLKDIYGTTFAVFPEVLAEAAKAVPKAAEATPAPRSILPKGDRGRAAKLAGELVTAFTWSDTPQGLNYWDEVQGNLKALGGDA